MGGRGIGGKLMRQGGREGGKEEMRMQAEIEGKKNQNNRREGERGRMRIW